MKRQDLICIGCPLGCMITVELDQGDVSKVEGHGCRRGETYAKKECLNPTRIVTSRVPVNGGVIPVVSVKTEADIPKEKIMDCMEAIKGLKLEAPIKIGDVVLHNVAGTQVNVIATKNIMKH